MEMNILDKDFSADTCNGRHDIIVADVLKVLREKPSMWQEPLLVTARNLLFLTKNMFQSKYIFLSSATTTTHIGIEDSLPRLLDGIKHIYHIIYQHTIHNGYPWHN